MDENLIQLLIWMIAYEICKNERLSESGDHSKVFHKIRDSLSKEYNIFVNNDDSLSDSRIKLGKKMIDFYYDNFIEGSADDTQKLIEIPLMTGKYVNEFIEKSMIGDGAFGNVYRAEHMLDHQEYAVKKVSLYGMGCEKCDINMK
jgi:hypothetical protein